MVKIDFTMYNSFATCPTWWRNFVNAVHDNAPRGSDKSALQDERIAKYHGRIIEGEKYKDIDYLEFDREEDSNAFQLFWALYGK